MLVILYPLPPPLKAERDAWILQAAMLPSLHQVVRTAGETLHRLLVRLQAKSEDGQMSPLGSWTGVSFQGSLRETVSTGDP